MGIRYFLFLRSILSGRRPMSYRNQSIDLQSKSIDWFLYDKDLRLERVSSPSICYFPRFIKMVISNIPAITLGLHTSKTGFSCHLAEEFSQVRLINISSQISIKHLDLMAELIPITAREKFWQFIMVLVE